MTCATICQQQPHLPLQAGRALATLEKQVARDHQVDDAAEASGSRRMVHAELVARSAVRTEVDIDHLAAVMLMARHFTERRGQQRPPEDNPEDTAA